MIRVMLVDDHILVRQGTHAFLSTAADIEVVAETGEAGEAMSLALRARPDVVLLDIRLHQGNGIDIARAIRHELPDTKVVMLTTYDDEVYVLGCFALDIHGYLLKTISDAELIAAIRAAMRGEQVLSAEIVELAAARSGLALPPVLSPREYEVLTLIARGDTNQAIGRQLGLKETTIESYVSNLMGKLSVRSRTEAVIQAVRQGILAIEQDVLEVDH